ncbi:MAG: M23 family metallopeptidase [Candidatus Latescibacteria bacterium]|nr:M23 family metallopeptidase [Candidatus Latescibacterota bacterium]
MKKYLTLMVIPHNESHVREMHLSRPVLLGTLSAVGLALCTLLFFTIGFIATSGQRAGLVAIKAENLELKRQFVLTQEKLENMRHHIDRLTQKDRSMRAWVELEEPGDEVRQMGVGGGDDAPPEWEGILSDDVDNLLSQTYTNMDQLLREARFLEASFDTILSKLTTDTKKRQHIPSITPVVQDRPWISSVFGTRRDPFTGRPQFHNGIDFPGWPGTIVVATADGVVDKAEYDRRLGNYVAIDHGYGLRTVYGHMRKKSHLKVGDRITRGDKIGEMGKTGRSTATHLHYSVVENGIAKDPKRYIFDDKVRSLY